MLSIILKSKLHRVRCTECAPDYQGSLLLDGSWMEEAGIVPWEKILVANRENGERFETYAIPGENGSGVCCLNGAAACKGQVGDHLIIMTFALFTEEERLNHKPTVVLFDEENNIIRE